MRHLVINDRHAETVTEDGAPVTDDLYSVMVTNDPTMLDDDGRGSLDIFLGVDQYGAPPVHTSPQPLDADGAPDWERVHADLEDAGFELVHAHWADTLDQPGVWTATSFGWVATAVRG